LYILNFTGYAGVQQSKPPPFLARLVGPPHKLKQKQKETMVQCRCFWQNNGNNKTITAIRYDVL